MANTTSLGDKENQTLAGITEAAESDASARSGLSSTGSALTGNRASALTGGTTTSTLGSSGTGTLADSSNYSQQSGQQGARIVGDGNPDASGPGPKLMTADTLIGNSVTNPEGETLGEIEDIMLDVSQGSVAYAVMSAGGFLGIGEKLFALPWSALTLDTENKCFIINASKDRIKSAPGFDKDHWPSQADSTWQQAVGSYWR